MRVEVVDARKVRFQHDDFKVDRPLAAWPRRCSTSARSSATTSACRSRTASTSRRCRRASTPSGRTSLTSKVVEVDLREQTIDVAGQEIMTADKVTLRMNAVVTYRIVDARQAVSACRTTRRSRCTARRSWRCGPSSARASSTRS